MADEKSISDALEDLHEESEATERIENNRNDNAGLSNPETRGFCIRINNSLDCYRNVSTSSYSRETSIGSNSSAQFNIPSYGRGHSTSASHSIATAQPSSSGASEESRASSFRVRIAAPRGIVHRTDNNHSNLPSQNCFETRIWRPWLEMEPENASFGADINSCKEGENSASKFFPVQKLTSPEVPIEREESGAARQTVEDGRQLSGTSAIFPPTEDVSSMERATDRASVGSVTGAEAPSAGGPSVMQTQPLRAGKGRPFVCVVCWKSFARKSNLKEHKRTHTGEKPFTCDKCGKQFAHRSNLTHHRVVHSDIRRFDCPKCSKKFRRKYDLDNHVRTHTDEQPFTCETCNKGFSRKDTLAIHRRTHTREQPVICELCGRDFTSRENCTEHQKREHGGR